MLTRTQDSEQIIERLAALDIGNAERMCCVRVPDDDHRGKRLLVAGERNPKVLAELARRGMRAKITVLEQAFTGHGNACLASILGNAAAGAGKTDAFPGERHRRIARQRAPNGPSLQLAGPSWSSSGTCWPTPTLSSTTSDPGSAPPASIPSAASAPTSASAKAPPGAAARPVIHQFSD